MSNEIFYRVALMRERWQTRNPTKPKFPTGHFHVAWVHFLIEGLDSKYKVLVGDYEKKGAKEGIDYELKISNENKIGRSIFKELTKLIKTIETSIINSLNNFNDLF